MKILYKSRATKEQLQDRIDKGNNCLELHTEVEDIRDIDSTMKVILNAGVDVYSVHAPITTRHTIEGSLGMENRADLRSTCELGQMCADEFGHMVEIVIHQELELFHMQEWGMYGRVLSFVEEILTRFPMIRINFENLSPYVRVQGRTYTTNAYYDAPVCLAKKLREDLNTKRVGVVFDTCHALNSITHNKSASLQEIVEPHNFFEHLELFLPMMHVIHLSNARGWGFDEDHGMTFSTEKDIEFLHSILERLLQDKYDGLVTLELKEDSLLEAKNQEILKSQIDEYLNQ